MIWCVRYRTSNLAMLRLRRIFWLLRLFRTRQWLQLRSQELGRRDTLLSKALTPVHTRDQETILDVGVVVHPIIPHQCLITCLQEWNNYEKPPLQWRRNNGLKMSSARNVVFVKDNVMARWWIGLPSHTPPVDSLTFMVIECLRVFTREHNNSNNL